MGKQVLWTVSVYLLAEHWTSHAGSSSGGTFADLLHLLLLPLATPGCTCCTSQKVEKTTTTVCCTLLQVTRLHRMHISKSRNNNNNSLLQAPPGDQIAHVAHLQRQQQQEQPFSVQIEATKRTTTTSLCFFAQNATGYSKCQLILFYSCFR